VTRAAPWLAALLVLVSCQTRVPIERRLSLTDPRIASSLEGLSQAAERRRTLRAQAKLALEAPDLRVRRPHRLVLARPTNLRVEVLGLFGQVAAILVTRGGRYQFFDPAQGRVEEGEVAAELLWRLARVDLTPEEAVEVLLGAPSPLAGLVPLVASSLQDGGLAIGLGAEGAGFAQQRFEFDGQGQIRSLKRFDRHGALLWTARFNDYRPVSGERFPFGVSLSFPRVEATAEIDFKSVELNPDLPSDVFVLSVPGGVQ
jgi:hypothetical protein